MTLEELGLQIRNYCVQFKIPEEYILDILIDQKVVPMIRGKATEYNAFLMLTSILNPHEWSVQKLNLNAQNGMHDEDVSVTHQRTGIIIKVECKNASRASMKLSPRCRVKEAHCTIKCHKSRSDLSKAATTNDRYLVDDFDIVISNLSNAVIAGGTYMEEFELVDNPALIDKLSQFYECGTEYQSIFDAAFNDWRCAKSSDIAVNGVIPRTPIVLLENDTTWRPLTQIEELLLEIVQARRGKKKTNSRRA